MRIVPSSSTTTLTGPRAHRAAVISGSVPFHRGPPPPLNCLLVTLLTLLALTHCCLTATTLAMGISKPYDPYRHIVMYYLAVRRSEMLYFMSLNHGFAAVLIFAPHRAPLLRPVHTAR
jgi:hypothetical protein